MIISSKKSYLLVASLAFIMPFLTGFLGLLPIDQSIIFEAGGRIAKGEMPYSDFYLPYGLVTALLQSLFFMLFGSTWFAYVLHAAVINCVFGILLLDVLRMWLPQEGIKKLTFIALLASWSFYPMMGTPFMDNHSFFFGFLAYWSVLNAIEAKKPLMFLFTFSFFVFGFYSKPLPVIFWVIPVGLELWFGRHYAMINWNWLISGCFIALLFLFLPFIVFNPGLFYYYTYLLPFIIGKARMNFDSNSNFLISLFTQERYKIWIGILSIIAAYFFFKVNRQDKNRRLAFFRSSSIVLASVVGAALTKNTFYHLLATAVIINFGVLTCFNFNNTHSPLLTKLYKGIIGLGWILLILVVSWLNFSRRVNEFVFYVHDLKKFSSSIGMFFKTPGNYYTPEDIDRLYNLMKSEHTLYIGDMFFLYSMTASDNPWPVSHLHDGTSYDSKDSLRFEKMKHKLVNNLQRYHTSVIVEDILFYGHEPYVQFANQLKGRERERIGSIVVYEMDHEKLAWMVSNLKISRDR